ncbi:hypothetical protein EDB87DRAFT_1589580 [Lactarius vividus]|nr:hypothetical protein EDB87DRAFT_1589580 [Lactarius vividus]
MEHPKSGSTSVSSYFTVHITQETLLFTDHLKAIVNLSLLTTNTMSCVIDFLTVFKASTPERVGLFSGQG